MRLYIDFFGADVLIASPLGLATKLEEGGPSADSLSSLELCIVDGADMMEMQNWSHVSTVFAALNQLPKARAGSCAGWGAARAGRASAGSAPPLAPGKTLTPNPGGEAGL